MSVCQSISLSDCDTASLLVSLSVSLSVYQYARMPVSLSVVLSVCLPACLSVSRSVGLSVGMPVCLSVCLCVRLSVYLFLCLLHCFDLTRERTYVRRFFRKSIIDDFNDGHLSLEASHHMKSFTAEFYFTYDLYANK